MIATDEFVRRFRAASGGALPTTLIAGWEFAVTSGEQGYADSLDEYRSDLAVRTTIERVFDDEPLSECPQLGWVREQVGALDARFRALLQQDVVLPGGAADPWWLRHPLRYAGPEAATEFGVSVEVREA